ncbi:MAG: LysM peptidoglycan-binding domain-containing protein, partial [Shewanella sp.]
MLNWGLPITLCLVLLLVGCSFQASHPAPVESLTRKQAKQHQNQINGDVYKVKKGDTLYSISFAAGKDFTEIAKYNQLDKSYTIYPGQVLQLSEPNATKAAKSTSAKAKANNAKVAKNSKSTENQSFATSSSQGSPSGTSTKKTLDQKAKSEYSATSSQQIVNREASTLPVDVSQWQWPARGRLVGAYSANEQGNKGIKIAGQRGDIIKAAADGRVVYAGNALRGYG